MLGFVLAAMIERERRGESVFGTLFFHQIKTMEMVPSYIQHRALHHLAATGRPQALDLPLP